MHTIASRHGTCNGGWSRRVYIWHVTEKQGQARIGMLLSVLNLYLLAVAVAAAVVEDEEIAVSYDEYQLLRVYPSTTEQLGLVTDLVNRRKYEGLVSMWSQHLIVKKTPGSGNRTELSADLLSAPQVLDDLVEQLDEGGIPYDVLIHNLEVRNRSEFIITRFTADSRFQQS